MIRPFLTPAPEADTLRGAIAAAIPTLETERLILRAPRLSDYEVLEPIWRTDRAVYIGGPFNEEDAWLDFCQAVASWVLRGIGYWVVTLKNGTVLGFVGIGAETSDPELEFGWLLTAEAEGHGYATEAARTVHGYAFGTLGLKTLISFVERGNAASIRLAQRLGAVEDPAVLSGEDAEHAIAFRHSKGAVQ
ncbi:MAG: GNAT family N-acetyltransferase [Pseudomonadota bacterium]